VFVCENNLYGEYTPWEQVTAGQDICGRARVLDVPAEQVDGNDVRAVEAAARGAIERARSGAGPTLLECLTYRFVGHSRSDPGLYRKPGELERWRERDPLKLTRAALIAGGMDDATIAAIEERVDQAVDAAFDAALAAPFPSAEEVAHA
jgi:TPP-dependent pyruvate/acetoin dehydrogenase alpha subunit